MRVLSTTQVFPNAAQPVHGVFVRERLSRLAALADLEVVAPLPYFPGTRMVRPSYRPAAPYFEQQGPLRVWHPRFFNIPALFKPLDGVLYFASCARIARRLHRLARFDIVDAHFVYPDSVGAALLAGSLGLPLVVTVRGGNINLFKAAPLRRAQVKRALRQARRVIAVSESLRVDAIELGAAPDLVHVIPNGVDDRKFYPVPRARARASLGLALDGPLIVSVGNLVPRKGFGRVVEVLPQLLERHPSARYLIVGGPGVEGNAQPSLERARRASGVGERVVTVGAVDHDAVACFLNAGDVVCLPSSDEGCPNVLLEALACGTPVVASRVGGVEEIVDSDEVGLLAPPGDQQALCAALDTALTRRWDREKVRRRLAGRSWEAVATAVHGVLEGLVIEKDRSGLGQRRR